MANAGGFSFRRLERLIFAIGGVTVLVGLLTQKQDIALGLAVGVALTCANFFVLRKLVAKWTRDAAKGAGGTAQLLALPKMVALMLLVVAAIVFLPIDPIAFTIGYSIFIPSIVIEGTYSALRDPSRPEDVDG